MKKIRKWFNKPKKEAEDQLTIQPLTPERKRQSCHDVTVVMETLRSAPQRLAVLLLDLRELDRDLIGHTRTDGSDPDLILTTRLSMLRELLQGDVSQEEEVQRRQHYCPEHLRTTTTTTTKSAWSPQTPAPLPVWRSQVEQVTTDTGSCDIITPAGGGATNTSVSSPGLPDRPLLKARGDCSLPSSPHPGGRRGLPCSLPCSPLLGVRHQRSSPSPPSGLSRLWVEAALQRSKNIQQTEPCPPPPCSPQVRQEGEEEGVKSKWGKTEEYGEEEEWSDEEEGEDKQENIVNIVGIRLSDTVIFRPLTSPRICGREEEEKEDSDLLCCDSEVSRYCLLTPCVCFRCPSAPPYEEEVFTAREIQTVSQKHSEGLTRMPQRTEVQGTDIQSSKGDSKQGLRRDRAPQLGESSHLYPSLSLWRITAESQTVLNRKQEEEVKTFNSQLNHNTICLHGNNTNDHLQQLCEMIAGELQTLCSVDLSFILTKVFDSTTCSKRTVRAVESCSFCSDKLRVQIMKHLCRNCDKVFCGRCLSHFVCLLQIHQFSQTAAV